MKNEGVSDFLDNQIVSGAWVVYPQRWGSSLSMKLGRVSSVDNNVVKVRSVGYRYNYATTQNTVEIGREAALQRPDRATVVPAEIVPAAFVAAVETR